MDDHDDQPQGQGLPLNGYFKDLATAEIEEPVWVVKNVIPRGVTFMAGPPKGSMKSTMTAALAALVSGHKCDALPGFMSEVANHGPVMWLSAEANAGELKDMLVNGMGVELEANESLLVADDPWEFRLDDPDGWKRLHEWLLERGPRLVIIDPLAEFHDLDEKVAGDMVRLLRPIRKWAVENNRAVILVHHVSKKSSDQKDTNYDPMDMRGSTAFFGKADAILMMTPKGKEEERRVHVQAIFKRASGWKKEIQLSVYNRKGMSPVIFLNDLAKKVHTMMALGANDVNAMAQQLNVGPSATRDALKALEENKLVKQTGEDTWKIRKGKQL